MKVILDTNANSELRRGHEGVAYHVRGSEQLLMSAIVIGELFYGFHKGTRFVENRRDLEMFLDSPYVSFLPVTSVTADRFGRIASSLKKKGKPIPSHDIWIAAHAMEWGADLVSFDNHFGLVEGLA